MDNTLQIILILLLTLPIIATVKWIIERNKMSKRINEIDSFIAHLDEQKAAFEKANPEFAKRS